MIALLDNTVLSNFTAVGRPDLVRLALGEDAATSEAAWAELQTGIRIGKLPALDWTWLPVLPLTEAEKPLYELRFHHIRHSQRNSPIFNTGLDSSTARLGRPCNGRAPAHFPLPGRLTVPLRKYTPGMGEDTQ